MACDATARLYDVDEDSVVFKKLQKTSKYDQGTVTFRARKGKRIELDKLHESLWATRLSGGTRSGLVSLQVTAVGHVDWANDTATLKVDGSDQPFVLARHNDTRYGAAFETLRSLDAAKKVRLTGVIDHYSGRWPGLLKTKPVGPRKILVMQFEDSE